ncbi:MAG: DMT family transporter, partial [Deltaproteobacteria bacterium]|jgi:drug/metabolite transporter (DMT)-like permease|nr:DMT family transporter [Deltaproteobacteria bacterium]
MTPRIKAALLLLTATFIWGASFPTIRYSVALVDPFAFTGIKFLFSAAALLPMALMRRASSPGQAIDRERPHPLTWLWAGLAAGVLLTVGTALQYQGMVWTTSAKSGFISGLYVTLVPPLGLVLGRIPSPAVWMGLVMGLSGLMLVSNPGGGEFNRGDALTLAADLFWAVHVLLVGRYAIRVNPFRFVGVQVGMVGAVCLGIAFARGALPDSAAFIATLPFSLFGILSVSMCYFFQVTAQKDIRPSEAALLLQLQAVFAAIFGMIFLDEMMTPSMWAGAALVVAGSITAQHHSRRSAVLPGSPHSRGLMVVRVATAALVLGLCFAPLFLI